jgi:hypothetical protein
MAQVDRHGAMNPAGRVRCNMRRQIELGRDDCNLAEPGDKCGVDQLAMTGRPAGHGQDNLSERGGRCCINRGPILFSLMSEESYDQLSSPDPQQVDLGMAALRTIKANETIEQAQSGPVNMVPADAEPLESSARDLSEPVSFSSPTKRRPRPRSRYSTMRSARALDCACFDWRSVARRNDS